MRTKISFLVLALLALVSFGAGTADAQTATFPAGCTSALGYSVTTGNPCNGTSTATIGPLPGCTTALGYSTVDGRPCSGGSVAINFLAGCNSIYGYSTISGLPCNGTGTVSMPSTGGGGGGTYTPPINYTPGFPTTGYGGDLLINILFLGSSALIAALGLHFFARRDNA